MKPMIFRPFEPAFRSLFDSFFDTLPGTDGGYTLPAVNVRHTPQAWFLEIAAPGLAKDDFKVAVEQGVLTVSAEKRQGEEDQTDQYTRREFRYTSFRRSFSLPEGVREEDIKASCKDGVLTLELPRRNAEPEQKGRIIEIA